MAKRKKKKEARMTEEQRAIQEITEVVGALMCPKGAIDELNFAFAEALVTSGAAHRFARFAELAWADRQDVHTEIAAIARALQEEHRKYVQAVEPILDRLDQLEASPHDESADLAPEDVLDRLKPAFEEVDEVDEAG